jgi:NADH dehydrogenase
MAPGLKTLEDAVAIRTKMLRAFEDAERRAATGELPAALQFVVIGGGPTGVEMAGTMAEVAHKSMVRDFRHIDPRQTRILLLDAGPRILATYPEQLSASALAQLQRLGVEVRTNTKVTEIAEGLVVAGGERIAAAVTVWAAGNAASPLGKMLGVPTSRAGQVLVEPDLSVPSHPEVFVIGDMAALHDANGKPLPGVAPVAMQQGHAVAQAIASDLRNQPRKAFRYHDKGSLATIGRAAAVADFGRIRLSGFLAWAAWLSIHIFFLIGFRNRLVVMIEWAWSYLTYGRGARLITDARK